MQETWRNSAFTCKTSLSRLHFWFILISFKFFFSKSKLLNSGCGLSASAAYTPVFTVIKCCWYTFLISVTSALDTGRRTFCRLLFLLPKSLSLAFQNFELMILTSKILNSRFWKVNSNSNVILNSVATQPRYIFEHLLFGMHILWGETLQFGRHVQILLFWVQWNQLVQTKVLMDVGAEN